MHLERTYIWNWRDLVEALVKHYQYNIDMALNRTQLQSLTRVRMSLSKNALRNNVN